MKTILCATVSILVLCQASTPLAAAAESSAPVFNGRFYSGSGDTEYLRMLDCSRRMFEADPEYASVPMLYQASWNGLVEGPTWGAWWVQNSYGTTYCGLPFYEEPLLTFLKNAQALWFNKMGDGKTSYVYNGKDAWVPPDGCLMDCANETWAMHKQGDGRVPIHDWGMEFTAAGGLLQSELLLITRDKDDLAKYLPKLERCASFIETRRNATNNLYEAGPAGNLLAPSYAGFKKSDGTYGRAYLAGLSITHLSFLDRLIELEKLAGNFDAANRLRVQAAQARQGLSLLTTDEGYFIKYMDPDGVRHGVFGAPKHGYFEASPNHDAIAFRIADDAQARRIYDKIASIPMLRPHHLIIANAPSLDDMYEAPQGLWEFGTWVNGGHWTTCEARMMLAYCRLGQHQDALASMRQIMTFADRFRMDNPLVKFGSEVYQPKEPINVTYDAFGAPAGMIRGLFEYLYRSDELILMPHIPSGISSVEQKFPIRFGSKRIYIAASGRGDVASVELNGKPWKAFDAKSISLPYSALPDNSAIHIRLGTGKSRRYAAPKPDYSIPENALPDFQALLSKPETAARFGIGATNLMVLLAKAEKLCSFHAKMTSAGLGDSYEAAHARMAVAFLSAASGRLSMLEQGKLSLLPEASQQASIKLYFSTAEKLIEGLEKTMKDDAAAGARQKQIHRLWIASGS